MSNRRSNTSSARGPSRKRIWARQNEVVTGTVDGVHVDLLQEFEATYGAQLIGSTVARVRGKVSARPTLDAPTNVNPFITFGAIVLNTTGVGQDVAPLDEPHADWAFYEPCFALNRDISTAGDFATAQVHCDVDIKSMRKIEELNQSFFLVVQSPNVDWTVALSMSVLVLLP